MKKIIICLATVLSVINVSAQTAKVKTGISPFTISVKAVSTPGLPLQSFVNGRSGDYLLVVGGRTNGYHGTNGADPSVNFPTYYSNRNLVVYNPLTGALKSVTVPQPYYDQLTSTNLQGYQDGSYLYICGGYGQNSAGNYVTYNGVIAMNVDSIVKAINNNDTLNLTRFITSTTSNDMAITGGELFKVGNYFYLVMGQNFTGKYAPTGNETNVQVYSDEIRQFSINLTGNQLSVQLIKRFTDGNKPDSTTQFRRRDLNVVPIKDANGKDGLAVYGGVFTYKYNGVWQNPVYLLQDANNNPVVTIDNNFSQKCNQYGCAEVLIYDPLTKTMSTSLLGGISYYDYNASGVLQAYATVPFVKIVSTINRLADGTTTEIVAPQANSLPDWIGAEAKFFPLEQYLLKGHEEILDWSKIPAGKNTVIGYMYGGIKATASQSSYFNPTASNRTLYQVIINRTAAK